MSPLAWWGLGPPAAEVESSTPEIATERHAARLGPDDPVLIIHEDLAHRPHHRMLARLPVHAVAFGLDPDAAGARLRPAYRGRIGFRCGEGAVGSL